MNPCNEISSSISKFTTLGDGHHWDERPNLTYPTVTKWGIKEMTRSQQHAYFEKYVQTPQEKETEMRNRIAMLEEKIERLEVTLSALLHSYSTHWHEDNTRQ